MSDDPPDWPDPTPPTPECVAEADYVAVLMMRAADRLDDLDALLPAAPWHASGQYPQRVTNDRALVIAECYEGSNPVIADAIAGLRSILEPLGELLRSEAEDAAAVGPDYRATRLAEAILGGR